MTRTVFRAGETLAVRREMLLPTCPLHARYVVPREAMIEKRGIGAGRYAEPSFYVVLTSGVSSSEVSIRVPVEALAEPGDICAAIGCSRCDFCGTADAAVIPRGVRSGSIWFEIAAAERFPGWPGRGW